jgi:hypothetical protein
MPTSLGKSYIAVPTPTISPGEGLGGRKLLTKPLPASARNWPKHEGLGSLFGPNTEKPVKNDLVKFQAQLPLPLFAALGTPGIVIVEKSSQNYDKKSSFDEARWHEPQKRPSWVAK